MKSKLTIPKHKASNKDSNSKVTDRLYNGHTFSSYNKLMNTDNKNLESGRSSRNGGAFTIKTSVKSSKQKDDNMLFTQKSLRTQATVTPVNLLDSHSAVMSKNRSGLGLMEDMHNSSQFATESHRSIRTTKNSRYLTKKMSGSKNHHIQ